ncbi:MAG: helix-turn-helix domain-containing protein [Vampirovibrio sp.]|nr:helix-turn-helix domain-containing protein [Vampirovibrio sp.]
MKKLGPTYPNFPDQKQIGARLRQARLKVGMKQQQVAKHLKVGVSAISALERGTRKLDAVELFLLSTLYNQSMESFFDVEGANSSRGDQHGMTQKIENKPPHMSISLDLSNTDPVVAECVRLIQQAPKKLQRSAAYGVIGFLSER